jgi:pyruvate ferredoxin oxidoreductase gamma subunit
MYDIRFHGRGGQGAVICATMLAAALAREGKYALAFPRFGTARRGGEVTAFVRISDLPSEIPRCQVYEPDCLVIMHPSLLELREVLKDMPQSPEVLRGFRDGGLILINSSRAPEEFNLPLRGTIATVNGTAIAEQHHLGTATSRPVNTAIIGALVKATELVGFSSLETAIRLEVPQQVEENLAAARDGFQSVKLLKEVAHA